MSLFNKADSQIFWNLLAYKQSIGGLIIVSIRPDKIADMRFVGGLLLRMRVPDKKTVCFRFLIRFFVFKEENQMDLLNGKVVLSTIAWLAVIFFKRPVLSFFGADADLLLLAQLYLKPIKAVFPLFLFNQMLAAFLRNDNHPEPATASIHNRIFYIFYGCCNGELTVLFNRQIMKYLGTNALAVYGPVVNVSTFVQ